MSSTCEMPAKRTKPSEPRQWNPVTKEDQTSGMPDFCIVDLFKGKPHKDFEDGYEALAYVSQKMPFDALRAGSNCNLEIIRSHKKWLLLILGAIRDHFQDVVFEIPGGACLQSKTFLYGGEFCTLTSWWFNKWMPVMEEDKKYGKMTYGNLYAMLASLDAIMTSETPYKTLKLKELP
jgi:hypothetical protein